MTDFGAQLQTNPSGSELTAEFANYLVAFKHLTAYQSSKLLMGKYKGFYLDHYLIREQFGKDQDFASYAGRDTRDGALVRLIITPINQTKGPGIEYRVEPYSE